MIQENKIITNAELEYKIKLIKLFTENNIGDYNIVLEDKLAYLSSNNAIIEEIDNSIQTCKDLRNQKYIDLETLNLVTKVLLNIKQKILGQDGGSP